MPIVLMPKTALKSILTIALVGFALSAFAGPFQDYADKLDKAKTRAEAQKVLRDNPAPLKDTEWDPVTTAALQNDSDADRAIAQIREGVHTGVIDEKLKASSVKDSVLAIKRNPLYRDPGLKQDSNWLGKALERLSNFKWDLDTPKGPNLKMPNIFGPWLTYLMWVVLAAAVGVFAWFAIKHVQFRSRLNRKAKAMLEDDEPERTVDEWLNLADEMAGDGKYRNAVRCLYLACLLRFDEAKVARFDRGQTNWEHLERINKSPRLPEGLDFSEPTRAFDLIWYGYVVNGMSDVDRFRAWYREVVSRLEAKAA